ncbi:MAG: hypothetical protein A2X46_08800 [Lentisphaerae bacterium GWF2_57_35]|nr:MAG: hypothetical protein A2X46_08800 [Lentisphaerae bacterium GWF2_57_35]
MSYSLLMIRALIHLNLDITTLHDTEFLNIISAMFRSIQHSTPQLIHSFKPRSSIKYVTILKRLSYPIRLITWSSAWTFPVVSTKSKAQRLNCFMGVDMQHRISYQAVICQAILEIITTKLKEAFTIHPLLMALITT